MTANKSTCFILDSSLIATEVGSTDLNAMADVCDAIIRLRDEGWAVTVVLSGDVDVARSGAGPIRGVSADRRYSILRAIGRPMVERWMSVLLQERGTKSASLTITRRAFGDRDQYRAIRETIVGLHANLRIPLIWDDAHSSVPYASRHAESEQLGSLLAGMLGVELCTMVFRRLPVEGAREKLVTTTDAPSLQRLVDGGELSLNGVSRDRFNSLLASSRLLRSIGIPLRWISLSELSLFPHDSRSGLVLTADERTRLTGVRRWLSAGAIPRGVLVASPQAALALVDEDRGSLLGAGVVTVRGEFAKDDVVAIEDESGSLLGYGICRFASHEVAEVRGKRDVIVVHANYFFGLPPPFIDEDVRER